MQQIYLDEFEIIDNWQADLGNRFKNLRQSCCGYAQWYGCMGGSPWVTVHEEYLCYALIQDFLSSISDQSCCSSPLFYAGSKLTGLRVIRMKPKVFPVLGGAA